MPDEKLPSLPFPSAAWHSVYARYGDIVGRDPWHWAACHAVLCARMGRHLTFQHAYPHYGMEYLLIVIRTGTGKTSALRLAEHLLGPEVHRTSNVQSGQALGEALANVVWGSKNESHIAKSVSPHPTLLVENEFTRFILQAGIAQSTLLEATNELYDAPEIWKIQRVFRNSPLSIPTPSLSILASTTQDSFSSLLKHRLVSSGLLNRFLIFNLDGVRKEAFAPTYSPIAVRVLAQSLEEVTKVDKIAGQAPLWGDGKGSHGESTWADDGRAPPPATPWNLGSPEIPIADFYSPPALAIYQEWWEQACPITEDGALAPWFSRVQAHFHRIALSCIYYEHRTKIEQADAECAAAVLDFAITSTLTLAQEGLLPDRETPPWQTRTWAEGWILDRLAEGPLSQRRLQQKCSKLRDGTAKWIAVKSALDDLLRRDLLYSYAKGKQHLLRLATAPK